MKDFILIICRVFIYAVNTSMSSEVEDDYRLKMIVYVKERIYIIVG